MKVLKFGGSSVGCVDNLAKVKEIVEDQFDDLVVVVSAFGGVTDMILMAARTAAANMTFPTETMTEITTRHFNTISTLIPTEKQSEVTSQVKTLMGELTDLLKGVSLLGELTPRTLDYIVGYGERLSSTIIAAYLKAEWIDSSKLIITDEQFGKATVDFVETERRVRSHFHDFSGVAIAPGFISSSSKGIHTTLGRGGSDYTASILASALEVASLEIWTDVDGFMSADPRVINNAYTIDYLTYTEAMELSHFGAKVIYPPTILPVYQKDIPVWIKNTCNPLAKGTLIGSEPKKGKNRSIKGISSIPDVVLMTVQGIGMVGVTGISSRLFSALAKADVNAILISQASSENSITIAITGDKMESAKAEVNGEFKWEIEYGQINPVVFEKDLSVIAIVGENMKENTGVAGKLFETIGKNGINVQAIAQGASELNISWVVKKKDLKKTLNVVHEGFFLSEYKELNIFMMGIGTVGGHLIDQIKQQQQKLMEENALIIKVVAIANSRKMVFDRNGVDLDNYMKALDASDMVSNIESFKEETIGMNIFNPVFVDCTANADVATIYQGLLDASVSIVAANKVAASSDYESYKSLKETAKRKGIKFYFETNVGAGLPVLSTIKDLVNSGDKILKIQAVLSGTLNYIFNTISADIPLSRTIEMAKEAGFSEPDPRIDLSGKDVMRKLLILAREGGYDTNEDEIKVTRFIPNELFAGSMDDFWSGVKGLDGDFEKQRQELEANDQKWRFIGTFEPGDAHCSLQAVEANSPFYDLEGSNNIVLFTTERYNEFPMQIKGYGAGASVTAAGVFADIIRIANI